MTPAVSEMLARGRQQLVFSEVFDTTTYDPFYSSAVTKALWYVHIVAEMVGSHIAKWFLFNDTTLLNQSSRKAVV